jgi:thioredoxin 1
MLLPVVEGLAEEVTDAKICKINVDEQQELAAKYKVMTIPTLIVVKNGKEVSRSVGVKPKDEILKMIHD